MRKIINAPLLAETQEKLLRLKNCKDVKYPYWNVSEICQHCAQTINHAMIGYPRLKPALIRATVGQIAIRKFLSQGFMKHNLTAPVPGGAKIDASFDSATSIDDLLSTIQKFSSYSGQLQPHLLFGKLSKNEYDSYFAMHILDHLSELTFWFVKSIRDNYVLSKLGSKEITAICAVWVENYPSMGAKKNDTAGTASPMFG